MSFFVFFGGKNCQPPLAGTSAIPITICFRHGLQPYTQLHFYPLAGFCISPSNGYLHQRCMQVTDTGLQSWKKTVLRFRSRSQRPFLNWTKRNILFSAEIKYFLRGDTFSSSRRNILIIAMTRFFVIAEIGTNGYIEHYQARALREKSLLPIMTFYLQQLT